MLYPVRHWPQLLRSLLRDQVPDETRPFQNPSELSSIVSTLKTHQLLSEHVPYSADPKHTVAWASAVDAWVDRLLILTRSDSPDKCWAGVCLLGVTISECTADRFLGSHSEWFNALLSHIQLSGASQFVWVASCAAVSDLLTRLAGFSNLKKDGSSHAGKLLQLVLKMFNEGGGEVVLDVAGSLLSTILTHFPVAVYRYHENFETVIVSKLMDSTCSANSSKKLAFCLALLPKSKGDEESWSVMMQKILLSVSSLLNEALEGLEEDSRRDEAVALLVLPGKDPPPSLGGCMMPGEALKNRQWSPEFLISSLMRSCCTMLTSSYPVLVSVPVLPLLAIIRRVLMVNGSLPETLKSFTTAMQQEFVCSQLPILHLYALEVLAATVKGLRSQLLPHIADIVRLLMGYLKNCWLPELRTKVYSILKVLLISMGCALYIMEEVIQNVSTDLKVADSGTVGATNEQPPVEVPLQHPQKKRKHGAATVHLQELHALLGSQVEAPRMSQALIALKVAALEALEALLIVGGAFNSDSWRRRIDHLLIEVATDACGDGLIYHVQPFPHKESRVTWEHFQLVALRALLASLLSPTGVRPPYLAQGRELFYKGKQHPGSKVAEFCAQALLALEVFVHPRALPLIDASLASGSNYYSSTAEFGGPKHKSSSFDGMLRKGYDNPRDVYDFLNDIYLEDGSRCESLEAVNRKAHNDEKLPEISRDQVVRTCISVDDLSEKMISNKSDENPTPSNNDVQVEEDGDRVMFDVQHHEEPGKIPQEPPKVCGKDKLEDDMSDTLNRASASHKPVLMTVERTVSTTGAESAANGLSETKALNMLVKEPDNIDSDGSFPDIVDGVPDTDSDAELE